MVVPEVHRESRAEVAVVVGDARQSGRVARKKRRGSFAAEKSQEYSHAR